MIPTVTILPPAGFCAARTTFPAQLAEPVGDFTLVKRADGIRQWAYQGRGLYTYTHDLAPAAANGVGIDERWNVAVV